MTVGVGAAVVGTAVGVPVGAAVVGVAIVGAAAPAFIPSFVETFPEIFCKLMVIPAAVGSLVMLLDAKSQKGSFQLSILESPDAEL